MEKLDKTSVEALDQFNLRIPHELKMKFKKIAVREEREMTEIIVILLSDYVKIHGEGNPAFELDNWIEQPKFKAHPAFMRTLKDWKEYIESLSIEEVKEIETQANSILFFAEKKVKYGTTNVKTY